MNEPSLKRKVESVLFSAGKYMSVREIAQLCGRNTRSDSVLKALQELEEEYKHNDTSLMVATDGENWKMTVREAYSPVVRRIVSTTELAKSVMETLAVIAYKAPVLQSEVIHIRTNKAYDHIKELQEAGFITRKPEGRTKRIDLTQKFFDYFDLPPEDLKKRFARIKELDEHVQLIESAANEKKKEHAQKTAEVKEQEERMKQEFEQSAQELDRDLDAHPRVAVITQKGEEEILEEYAAQETYDEEDSDDASPIKRAVDHLGKLEVVDTTPEPLEAEEGKEWGSLTVVGMKDGESADTQSDEDASSEDSEEAEDKPAPSGLEEVDAHELKGGERLKLPEGSEHAIDARVDELLNPEKEEERKERERAERAKRLEEPTLEEKKEEQEKKEDLEEQKKEVAPEDEELNEASEDAVKEKVEEQQESVSEESKEHPEESSEELDEVSKAMKDL